MSSPSTTSLLNVDVRPGKPPMLRVDAIDNPTGWAAAHRDALRAAVAEQDGDRPSTATEHWLAAAWAEVLGIPKDQIGRRDHFFDLGGTSLSALKLAIALDRAVSFRDLASHPILADQATLVDGRLDRDVRAAPVSVRTGGCTPAFSAHERLSSS